MSKEIKILILNIHSDRNAGDYALSRMSISQLKTVFPNCSVTLSMNDPDSYTGDLPVVQSPIVWIKRQQQWEWGKILLFIFGSLIPTIIWRIWKKSFLYFTPTILREWVSTYISADIIVSAAGGYQYSSGKGLTFLLLNFTLLLSKFGKKPLYFLPQSFGPYYHWWEKIITRYVCNFSQIVMVREPVSYQNLINCSVTPHKLILHPDIAFGFIGAPQHEASKWFNSIGLDIIHDRPFLGMTIINWRAFSSRFHRQDEYENAISTLIEFFINEYNGKVIILPQTWGPTEAEDDRLIGIKIEQKLKHLKPNLIVITQPIHPKLLQTIFGMMDAVVGTRMHSNIFALTHGTPALPIGYLHKSVGIAKMLGIEEWVIDINEINNEVLLQRFSDFWDKREIIRSNLKANIPNIISDSKRFGEIISDDYNKHYKNK